MKPVISLIVLLALALSVTAKPTNINKHVGEIGPNPTHFNGKIKTAKIYFKAADGRRLPGHSIYKAENEKAYTIRSVNGNGETNTITIYLTNKDNTKESIVVKDMHEDKVYQKVNILENGNAVRTVSYNDDKTKKDQYAYTYDDQGRLSTVTHLADGQTENNIYEGNTIVRSLISKDGTSNELTRTDTYELDNHNNPIKIVSRGSWGQTEPKVFTFKYTYDSKGNYTSVEMYRDGKHFSTQYRDIEYN